MSKLLINEEPLQVLPSLAKKIGLNEAIFLQQVHYWLGKSRHTYDGHQWIYNTYLDWEKQFPWWSGRTIKRIVEKLRDKGLLITTSKYNKLNIDQTLWYTIDYAKLSDTELAQSHSDKVAQSDAPKVTSCHSHSDKVAQSAPVAESDNLSLPITRDLHTENSKHRDDHPALPNDEPKDGSRQGDGDDHPPGALLRTLLDDAGFVYRDRNLKEIAVKLEDSYTIEQLVRAVGAAKDAHTKQIMDGKKGIMAPAAYVASILAEAEKKPPPPTKQMVRIYNQYTEQYEYREVMA